MTVSQGSALSIERYDRGVAPLATLGDLIRIPLAEDPDGVAVRFSLALLAVFQLAAPR